MCTYTHFAAFVPATAFSNVVPAVVPAPVVVSAGVAGVVGGLGMISVFNAASTGHILNSVFWGGFLRYSIKDATVLKIPYDFLLIRKCPLFFDIKWCVGLPLYITESKYPCAGARFCNTKVPSGLKVSSAVSLRLSSACLCIGDIVFLIGNGG